MEERKMGPQGAQPEDERKHGKLMVVPLRRNCCRATCDSQRKPRCIFFLHGGSTHQAWIRNLHLKFQGEGGSRHVRHLPGRPAGSRKIQSAASSSSSSCSSSYVHYSLADGLLQQGGQVDLPVLYAASVGLVPHGPLQDPVAELPEQRRVLGFQVRRPAEEVVDPEESAGPEHPIGVKE